MDLSSEVLEELKRIAGAENVITDSEDLYVYSFEGPIGLKRGLTPSAVVKLHSEEEVTKVRKLAQKKGFYVVPRSEEVTSSTGAPVIIIDFQAPVDIKTLKDSLKVKRSLESRIQTSMYTSFPEWFINFLSTRLIYQCKECSKSSGTACSGYCTVGTFFNGLELWSSKGRLLIAKGLLNGDLTLTRKLIDSIYTCSLCGQCYDQCALGGLEVYKVILLARRLICEKGLAPEPFKELLTRILQTGTPFTTPFRTRRRTWWFSKLTYKPKTQAEVLYWSGCLPAYRFQNMAVAACTLLGKANVEFTMLGEEEGCCGYPLVSAGFWTEAKENAIKIVQKIMKTGAKKLVTGCAGCYYTFKRLYPEVLGVHVPFEVFHLSQFLQPLVKSGDLKLKSLKMKVTYHDPCSLGRHCGVYDPPRNLLQAIPDLELIEIPLNRSHSTCCGGGGGLWTFNTELAMNIARAKLIEQVVPLKVEAIVTSCPTCYMNFDYVSEPSGIGIKVYDLTELVLKAFA
jgi:glycolate oxidase